MAFALGALAPAVASAGWPVYGHDLANSRDAGTEGPPPGQVTTMTPKWIFNSTTGDFTGTPVVAGGVLVAGDNGGSVYALNAVTGKLLWSKSLGQPINGSAAIDLNAPGGATAFVPVAQQGSPHIVALSLANGATRWQTVLSNQPDASSFGSPTFWNGTLYMGTSGPNDDNSTARGSVVAVDEASGAIRWQTFTVPPGHDGAPVWSTPSIDTATGLLYVGTGNNYHPPTTDTEDSILALDAATGAIVAHYQATANDTFDLANNPAGGPDSDFGASANLFTGPGGEQLVGEGQKSGTYWAVDRATMRPVWNTSIGPAGPLGGIVASTASDGRRIYGTDTITGVVTALTRTGSVAWTSPDPGGLHLGPHTVAHGVLYTDDLSGFMTAREAATGTILGKFPLGRGSFGGISAVGDAVYVAVGVGPVPPASVNAPGSIIAFGDTSHSGG
jgi:polyvinyl alcohol dehydrogenase (cytochrome)